MMLSTKEKKINPPIGSEFVINDGIIIARIMIPSFWRNMQVTDIDIFDFKKNNIW